MWITLMLIAKLRTQSIGSWYENFFNWYSGGGGVQLGPLDTAVTNGLLCQPRVITMMEKLVE
jgi:hypothetical protein